MRHVTNRIKLRAKTVGKYFLIDLSLHLTRAERLFDRGLIMKISSIHKTA